MNEHTPGPWFVHDFSDPAVSEHPILSDVTVSCDHPATIEVASMGRAMTATLDEARANARLIAAAPDMLAALKMVIASEGVIDPDALHIVAYVISRAKGRR